MVRYIWIQNQKYYHYDDYQTYEEALKQAKRHRKRNGCRYFILKTEEGLWIPIKKYKLYLNKCIRINF